MKAILMPAPKQLQTIDVPDPEAGPEDVLLEIHYVGLCGSDLSLYRGTMPIASYPRIPGHELSGIVVARGEKVPDSIPVGTRATVLPYSECGICPSCRAGRPNCCQFNKTLGLQRDGAMSSHFAIHYGKVFGSHELTSQELALVEPLSVGYHAANRGRVSEADTVLVFGCGAVGMGVIAAAARKGATVIAVDVDAAKLAEARKLGAHHTVDFSQQDVLSVARELTHGDGVSVAIEAVGLPETFRLAVEAVAFAGRVVYVGYAKREVSYDPTLFVRKELDIVGSRNALRVFPAVIRMLERRERPFTDLISRIYPFAETGQAFIDWDAAPGKYTKIMIDVRGAQ